MNRSRPLFSARWTRPRSLAIALAGGAILAPGLLAQDENADDEQIFELDAYVVTSGIRDSLAAGVELKKESPQMLDAIVAEDIGKFPDNNVVEALQRVPGIQTTGRTRGEVSTVTIRGFNDIATTVNGRNIFTGAGRSVALADIPASLLYRVDVFKTRAASQLEQGIAGVIDIKTQRPFYFNDERTVVVARGIYSELADEINPVISGLYTNTFETDFGRIGFLINASYARTDWTDKSITAGAQVPFVTENPPSEFGFVPLERMFTTHPSAQENPLWQPGLESGLPFAPGSTLPLTPVGSDTTVQVPYYLARDAVFTADFYGQRERPAINAVLQWEPSDDATYTMEVFYNGYREDWQNNLQFSFADWWGNPGEFTLFEGTNIIKERSLLFPYMFMSGDMTVQSTDSFVYALNADWKIGDDLRITADLSYQTSEFETEFQGIRTDRVPYSITVDFNDDGGVPGWAFGDDPATADVDESSLTDPSLWNVAQFYDNAGYNEGDAIEFKVDGTYRPDAIEM
ncbi:MAG: TonB-dependent receptor plug domain-containing protein, partial [Opitutales bacterium]